MPLSHRVLFHAKISVGDPRGTSGQSSKPPNDRMVANMWIRFCMQMKRACPETVVHPSLKLARIRHGVVDGVLKNIKGTWGPKITPVHGDVPESLKALEFTRGMQSRMVDAAGCADACDQFFRANKVCISH